MFPYIHLGPLHLGTFGLLLWLAAVSGTVVLYRNFARHRVDADALNVVAIVTLSGVLGAKLWHELQEPSNIAAAFHEIFAQHGLGVPFAFLHWFQTGFAWFGGMVAGIAALLRFGRNSRFAAPPGVILGERVGALRMLDLAAPAAALGYGVGRIGCLTSGDGDYGIPTTLPWGVHMRPDALVPTRDLVQPTPAYEFLFALVLFAILWKLGARPRPIGWLTGLYLLLSGIGRFLVEFVRINPKIYFGMSNAQVAALLTVIAGAALMAWSMAARRPWPPHLAADTPA